MRWLAREKRAAEVARTEAREWNWELLPLPLPLFALFHQVYFLPLMFAQFKKFSIAICIRTHIRTCFDGNSNNRRRRRSRNNYEQGRGWAAPQGALMLPSGSGSGKIFAYAPWYDVNGNFPIDSTLFLLPGKTLFSFCFHVFYYFKF